MEWPKTKPEDKRFALGEPWPQLRQLILQAAKSAVPEGQSVRVRPLRASARGTVLHGLLRAMSRADIIVFDLTPHRAPSPRAQVNANVLFEIGLAVGMSKPTLVTGKSASTRKSLPSDLQGQFICEYGSPNGQRVIRGHIRTLTRQAVGL
jgi:nucleoside 2-deoxyribosyltransferase